MRLLLLLIALVTCFIAMVSFGETIPYNQHRHNSASYTINNIGDKSKDVCYAVNVIHSADNDNVPYNLTDVREHYKGLYKELGESQSILHNFRPDVQKSLTTPEARIVAAVNAFLDFHTRPKDLWTVLDPDLPNVKFVEINGHKEVVYNKYTGEKVAGVNAGTYNRAINQSSDLHAFVDVPLWFLCGTPTETQEEFARILAKDENLYKEFSKVTDSIVNDFMKSFGMEDDMIINLRSLLQGMQAKEEKEDVAEMFSRPVLSENPLAKTKKADNDMCYEDSQKNDEDAVNNSNKDNVAKTDIDEAKDSNDKGKAPESVTVEAKDDGVDLPILDIRIQEVIKAITILSSCMKEHNAAIDLVLRSQPKRAMNDVKGIIADGHAVSAERKKYEKRIKECILSLNVSILEMEKEFEDDSVGKLGETRRNTYSTVKPHIIKLFEILRDSPDVIRHIVEQVIPIQFARFLVNNDNKIRNKYLLKSTFGVDFGSYLK